MIKKIFLGFLLASTICVNAQKTTQSPYSFFGIGEEFSGLTVEQNAMGGIGAAYQHYKYLNFANPAAVANLRFTTYAFGLTNKDLTLKTPTTTQSSLSTAFNYVAIGFPIGKKAGFQFGLQPVSSVGYELTNRTFDTSNTLTEVSIFEGSGGVNRLHANFGINVLPNLSLGIEADFSFGNINNSILNQRQNVSLGTRYKEETTVSGTSLKFGAQYTHTLQNKLNLTLGAFTKLSNNLNVSGNDYLYSVSLAGGEVSRDTISTNTVSGKYILPLKTNFGIGIGKTDKWFASAEYESQSAIQTNGFLYTTSTSFRYGNSDRFSVGGYYIPKINSISSYFDRIMYSAGFRFENTGLLVDPTASSTNFTQINDFGISFGLSMPLKRLSTVNIALEYGQRGTTTNNLIQENYFNVRLSLSLTEIWFIKREID